MYFEFLISFFLAFIVAFSATPIARKIAFKIGAVDVPKDDRRMHNKPIARLGGLAIVAGFFVAFFFSIAGTKLDLTASGFDKSLPYLVLALIIIAVTGVIDDARGMKPTYKLALQVIAALLIVFGGDTRVMSVTNPFSDVGFYTLNIYVSYFVSVLWIIGITNALNLIDGLDGLASGVSAISCFSLFFIAILNQNYIVALMTVIIAGASLGFLPYNFNPAKIFMGDTGSMFLGFILSVLTIQGTLKSYAAISILIPVISLGLPLFDTTFAILRRIIKRKPIMQADRGHLHHRLIDMGLSQKQSVLVLYTASAALGLSAIVLSYRGLTTAIMMVVSVFVFVIVGTKYLSEFRLDDYEAKSLDNITHLPIARSDVEVTVDSEEVYLKESINK